MNTGLTFNLQQFNTEDGPGSMSGDCKSRQQEREDRLRGLTSADGGRLCAVVAAISIARQYNQMQTPE